MTEPSENRIITFLIGLGLLIASVAVIWFTVWLIIDTENQWELEQKKQDACLKTGGLWIDNRNTDGYCYHNK
ncbi:membrane protein [Streptomyces phage Emma1919]|uniref:Uncharacterized protein n=1 Tax=Streptomyces phage Gilson TaxID=2488789 RepID=A0A3T0ICX6_9CAUD|nr:hypothetical protein HWB98_gp035 [Streptomyces phage Gilson]AZU97294.1 hypothetical protein SEA_GILSON_249 [Streptomyces phage Gilson]URQ04830.1 membrane protein [Streptomyces phage Emma1919]